MCPSSRSWPPKLNRDTGQNPGAWFHSSSCSRPNEPTPRGRSRAVLRRYPIERLVRRRRNGNVLTSFDDGIFLLAVEPLT
jgi:hypothetical protein